jgi:hypothetical protein
MLPAPPDGAAQITSSRQLFRHDGFGQSLVLRVKGRPRSVVSFPPKGEAGFRPTRLLSVSDQARQSLGCRQDRPRLCLAACPRRRRLLSGLPDPHGPVDGGHQLFGVDLGCAGQHLDTHIDHAEVHTYAAFGLVGRQRLLGYADIYHIGSRRC